MVKRLRELAAAARGSKDAGSRNLGHDHPLYNSFLMVPLEFSVLMLAIEIRFRGLAIHVVTNECGKPTQLSSIPDFMLVF